MAKSASRMAYSAKPPGRGLADVALNVRWDSESRKGRVLGQLTSLYESCHFVASFPLSNALPDFIDCSCNITPHYTTGRRYWVEDKQRIDRVQSDVMHLDPEAIVGFN